VLVFQAAAALRLLLFELLLAKLEDRGGDIDLDTLLEPCSRISEVAEVLAPFI
jgi:hypothetical protein